LLDLLFKLQVRVVFIIEGYAILTMNFPSQMEKMVGYIEGSAGIGLCAGPVLGSILHRFGGFTTPFFTFGIFFIFCSPLIFSLVPKLADKKLEYIPIEDCSIFQYKITYRDLLSHKRVALAVIAVAVFVMNQSFLEPILSTTLFRFGLNEHNVGLIFALQTVTFAITTRLVHLVPQYFDKRSIITPAIIFSGIIAFLYGPSELLGLPNELWVICAGFGISGIFLAFGLVSVVPEMINALSYKYDSENPKLNDLVSGLFNAGFGMGQIIGPLAGSFLTHTTTYRTACDLVAMSIILFGLAYCVLCGKFSQERQGVTDIEKHLLETKRKLLVS